MSTDRTRILLSAIDNALRNGSYMTGANVAFEFLCDELGVDREALPPFNPRWAVAELERAAADHHARGAAEAEDS